MKISSATASSLGEKLAGLNLSDEEGVLLASMLASNAGDEAEVEGFGDTGVKGFYPEVEIHLRTNVLGPLPDAWKPERDSYMKIEMER